MENLEKMPADLKWVGDLVTYDSDKMVVIGNPCTTVIQGKRVVIALSIPAVVAVEHERAGELGLPELNPAHDSFIQGWLERPGASHTFELAKLKAWLGGHQATEIYFDDEGNGPNDARFSRSCLIFDAHFDANLIATALAGWREGPVNLVYHGALEPLVLTAPGAYAVIMPLSTSVPRITAQGLQGGWGDVR